MKQPQIVAMGGGGFSMEPDNLLLEEYFVAQAGKRNPSVCFLPTASGDADEYIVKFYAAFGKLRCRPRHLSLFRPPRDMRNWLLAHDAIYVGGGNTKSMLALWREWSVDAILRQAWQRGVLLGGLSAGSICWFKEGLTDSIPGRLTFLPCLGFLRGSHCPHYDSEAKRRPIYRQLIGEGRMKPGLAADDGVALHFKGQTLARVVSARPKAAAYSVRRIGGRFQERPIVPHYLGRTPAH